MMTYCERLNLIVKVLEWYGCLADKKAEPGPSMMACFRLEFDILRTDLHKLEEFVE